jgi:hypothetical protein
LYLYSQLYPLFFSSQKVNEEETRIPVEQEQTMQRERSGNFCSRVTYGKNSWHNSILSLVYYFLVFCTHSHYDSMIWWLTGVLYCFVHHQDQRQFWIIVYKFKSSECPTCVIGKKNGCIGIGWNENLVEGWILWKGVKMLLVYFGSLLVPILRLSSDQYYSVGTHAFLFCCIARYSWRNLSRR